MIVSPERSVRTRIIRGIPPHAVFSSRVRHLPGLRKSIPTVVRWCFLLFVFMIPFETIELISGALSPAKVSGVLFFASCMFFPRKCFPPVPRATWWFLGFVAVYALNVVVASGGSSGGFLSSLLTLTQLTILLWIASGLLKEEQLARSVLLTFSIATAFLAFGVILELPGFSAGFQTRELQGGVRSTPLGYSPNDLGGVAALAAVILIGLELDKRIRSSWSRLMLAALTLPLFVLLIRSGSRTGVLAFACGVSPFLLSLGRSNHRRMIAIAAAVAALVAGGYMVASDPLLSARWTVTFETGDMAGRENLFGSASEMIAEQPILGWGPIKGPNELGRRHGRLGEADPHNLLLHLLLIFGASGTFPFLVGLWLCIRSAWNGRAGNLGLLPLALLITMLVVNMANVWLYRKSMWLVLALALATVTATARRHRRPTFLSRTSFKTRL